MAGRFEDCFRHANAIEVCSVGAVEIANAIRLIVLANFEMTSGNDGRVADDDVIFRTAPRSWSRARGPGGARQQTSRIRV